MKKRRNKMPMTPDSSWFLAGMVVACGLMGYALLHAVKQTRYFEDLQGMPMPQFLAAVGTTVCFGLVGFVGIGLSFAARKFADDLWDRRH